MLQIWLQVLGRITLICSYVIVGVVNSETYWYPLLGPVSVCEIGSALQYVTISRVLYAADQSSLI
jgi:hypothetical protein